MRRQDRASPAIACHGLTKDYGAGRGVFDLDLTAECGEVLGSRTALVTGRLVALLAGSAAISLLALGALAAVAASVGDPLGAAGVGRVGVVSLLFAASLGALSALVSGIFRSSAAVVALALLVGASYLLSYLVPLFGWPDWLNRLSLFWAFGTPYTGWPSTAQLVTLLIVAVGGTVAATVVAERSSSVP